MSVGVVSIFVIILLIIIETIEYNLDRQESKNADKSDECNMNDN